MRRCTARRERPLHSRLIVLLAGLALAVAGCGGGDSTGTASASAVVTVEELDAAVRPAVQALLDAPGIEASSLTYVEGGELRFTRWMDYRSMTEFVAVIYTALPTGDGVNVAATTFTGGDRYTARNNPEAGHPWELGEPIPEFTERLGFPIGIDLEHIIEGSILDDLASVAAADRDASSRTTADGSVAWRLTAPIVGITVAQEWRVSPDGVLTAYAIESPTGELLGGALTKAEFEFTALTDPEPVARPEVGTPLDLDELGVPDGLALPG